MEDKIEPATIVLLNFVNPTKGTSSKKEKVGPKKSKVKNQYPIESDKGSSNGASNEKRSVKITNAPL